MNADPQQRLVVAVQTDVGCVRTENEDTVYGAGAEAAAGWLALLAVADGVGGHDAGAEASRLAVSGAVKSLANSAGDPAANPQGRLLAAFTAANQQVRGLAGSASERAPGTTLTLLGLDASTLALGHIGDSRAYRWRRGQLTQLSEDHTAVAEEVRRGTLTSEQAAESPFRHALVRGIGLADTVEPQVLTAPVELGDVFLLCSDGLWEYVGDPDLSAVLRRAAEPAVVCQQLVALARARGTADNVSVACAFYGTPLPAEASPPPAPAARRNWVLVALAVLLLSLGLGVIAAAVYSLKAAGKRPDQQPAPTAPTSPLVVPTPYPPMPPIETAAPPPHRPTGASSSPSSDQDASSGSTARTSRPTRPTSTGGGGNATPGGQGGGTKAGSSKSQSGNTGSNGAVGTTTPDKNKSPVVSETPPPTPPQENPPEGPSGGIEPRH